MSTADGGGEELERKRKLIEKAISIFEQKITAGQVKVTYGDYLRLLEFRKQLGGDEPKEITVTWVEQNKIESSEK